MTEGPAGPGGRSRPEGWSRGPGESAEGKGGGVASWTAGQRTFSCGIIRNVRRKGPPHPAAPRTAVPTCFPASARSSRGGVSRPPGVASRPTQAGAPSAPTGWERPPPPQPRRRWSSRGGPLAAPRDGALARPTRSSRSRAAPAPAASCAASHAQRFPARGRRGHGRGPALRPAPPGRVEPRGARWLRCGREPRAAGLRASEPGAFARPPSPKGPISSPDTPSRTS